MFVKFDEIPAMTLQDIKETKRYGRADAQTGQRENSIPSTNKVCGEYNYFSYFSTELYGVGNQKNRNTETVLLNTKNTCLN